MVLWMPGPKRRAHARTHLHVHASPAVLRATLASLTSLPRIRVATPGEFARRAYDNGKLDLAQVEGLADLLAAETEEQRKVAVRQEGGALSRQYDTWRTQLLSCLAHLEALIDFPEDDANITTQASLIRSFLAATLLPRVGALLQSLECALARAPAGKSSLLNFLAGREAAIVSAVPGTTRDVIEVALDLNGYKVILLDTAGIRDAADDIEREGMKRALAAAESAHVRLCVLDAHALMQDPTLLTQLEDSLGLHWPSTVAVFNKCDLTAANVEAANADRFESWLGSTPRRAFAVSGVNELAAGLGAIVKEELSNIGGGHEPMVTRLRHKKHLEECIRCLQSYLRNGPHQPIELAAEELRSAAHALGQVTGRIDIESVLGQIFSEFCIGK
eukprot:jgi/Chlat1/2161/Chrsp17S08745